MLCSGLNVKRHFGILANVTGNITNRHKTERETKISKKLSKTMSAAQQTDYLERVIQGGVSE